MSEVRIHNVQLEPNKHVVIALQKIFGIGPTRAKKICQEAGIQGSMNTKELSEDQKIKLKNGVGKFMVEGDLKREVALQIKRLIDIGSYRGQRHRKRLPVRGQRTRTNARTRKGPRGKTVSK